jgi:hypothetical protein
MTILDRLELRAAGIPAAKKDWANALSLLTAGLAVAAAVSGVLLSRYNARALMAKNEAILAQGRVADHWAHYQSRNIRLGVLEVRRDLGGNKARRAAIEAAMERLERDKAETYAKARSAEAERDALNAKSSSYSLPMTRLVLSLVLLQVALAMSPVYLALKKPFVLGVACAIGAAGVAALGLGLL